MTLAVPYKGRAIPCALQSFSSKTIKEEEGSRNIVHQRFFERLKDLLGEIPLILDREFSYFNLLEYLISAGIHFVIRLKMGSNPPKFYNEEGKEVELSIGRGGRVIHRGLLYKGKVRVNVIGVWEAGQAEPLWVMTDLEPEEGLEYYRERMKIEESYRDLKSLMGIGRVMSKRRENMEKIIGMVMLAYAVALLVGEEIRDYLFMGDGEVSDEIGKKNRGNGEFRRRGGKWRRYSGAFVLLKGYWPIPGRVWKLAVERALAIFAAIVLPNVLTHV
jgi:hypothetical protein